MIYGGLPVDLGPIDIAPVEMMFWLYCPIATPREWLPMPPNLEQFRPIVDAVAAYDYDHCAESYIYLTAKTLFVQPGCIGNRPGWHSDGFGTSDINYIWHDRAPTEFFSDAFHLPDDCADAMAIMAQRAAGQPIVTYPDKCLLRLDPSVIHRCPVNFEPGMRTFVKVSLSKDRYNLVGNSVNHGLRERWEMLPRTAERNHPSVHS